MGEEQKRFYWLKLQRDFFKRHDIRIVESMPNGKDYILFYLKLLCESVDHDGNLRFSEQIPYNEEMLAIITNTNVDIARKAVEIFTQLNMMGLMDDGTYFMTAVERMIGSSANNDNANRQRRFRENQKQQALEAGYRCGTKSNAAVTVSNGSVTESVMESNCGVTERVTKDNESKSIEKEIEKEIETEIENEYICTYDTVESTKNTHTEKEYIGSSTTRTGAREDREPLAKDDAWKTSKRARGAVAQRIVDRMAENRLEHARYPIVYDTVLRAMEAGIHPDLILEAANRTDYVEFNLWIEKQVSKRYNKLDTGPGV